MKRVPDSGDEQQCGLAASCFMADKKEFKETKTVGSF